MRGPVIDIHVHFGAPPDKESGCYWSEEFSRTAAYVAMLLVTRSLFKRAGIRAIRRHLLGVINGAKYVDQSVLLALDQVYSESGAAQPQLTHLYVPNRYIADLSRSEPRALFGCSIHPYRRDWREELGFCLENRAVLCKWIPSSQMIDPGHPNCLAFYKRMAEHRLPLLVHAGPEHAIPTSDKAYNQFNNPKHLRRALDEGVTVILAHCALPYFLFLDSGYQDDFDEFLKLFEEAPRKGWRLYTDVSALCTPMRSPYIETIKEHVPAERLLFGSDYPIPLFELSYNQNKGFLNWMRFIARVAFMKNPLDKNYTLVKGMGFGEALFSTAASLFGEILR